MPDKPTYRVRLHPTNGHPYSLRDDCGLSFTDAQRKAAEWRDNGVHATVAMEPVGPPSTAKRPTMTDKKKLPKVVKTREAGGDRRSGVVRTGVCNTWFAGRHGVFVAVPEHIHALIGVEGGAMWKGERVTVLGPHPAEECSLVCVRLPCGEIAWPYPDEITPAPKTRTVTLEVEVPVDVDPDRLLVIRSDDPTGKALPRRIVAMDGEEVDR